jgi:hypothetical protein
LYHFHLQPEHGGGAFLTTMKAHEKGCMNEDLVHEWMRTMWNRRPFTLLQ